MNGWTGLFNRPNMFGRVPDPPEPPECPERFIEDVCQSCSNYNECQKELEEKE